MLGVCRGCRNARCPELQDERRGGWGCSGPSGPGPRKIYVRLQRRGDLAADGHEGKQGPVRRLLQESRQEVTGAGQAGEGRGGWLLSVLRSGYVLMIWKGA